MCIENLIDNIEDDLKMFRCVRPNREFIKQLLEKLNIKNGFEFGKHYGSEQPFAKFANDYKSEFIWAQPEKK